MDNTLVNIISIIIALFVPLVTSYFSYKHSMGAQKERERTAFREIKLIIARFISQSQINPNLYEIQGLIKSKARQHNVAIGNIPSIPAIFEDVMTKLIENEFIPQDVKKDLISKVRSLQMELESKEAREKIIAETQEVPTADKYHNLISIFVPTVMVYILLVTIIYGLFNSMDVFLYPFMILAALFILIAAMYVYMKVNAEKEKKETENITYISPIFKNMVSSALQKHLPDTKVEKDVVLKNGKRMDFVLQINEERVPIEVKYRAVKSATIEQISDYMNQSGAKRAILITNSSVTERVRKSADAKNIIIFDNVNYEEDIINKFKEINLIEG